MEQPKKKDFKLSADVEHHLTRLLQTPELRSEIRAYLRQRLFCALQSSSLGPCLARRDAKPVSPTLHTLDLLIAEHLLRSRHHFTLSVFSCEVPSVACLAPSLQDALAGRDTSAVPFQREDLLDVLSALGVPPDSPQGRGLQRAYRDKPLLECVVRALPQLCHAVRDQATNTSSAEPCRARGSEARDQATNTSHTERVQDEGSVAELTRAHAAEERRLRDLVHGLQQQLAHAQESLAELRREGEVRVQTREEARNLQQAELVKQKQKLKRQQNKLAEEVQRLAREREEVRRAREELEQQLEQLTLSQPPTAARHALELQLEVKEAEVSELRSSLQAQQLETATLRGLTEQQRQRIEHLNIRMAGLVGELHVTREQLASHLTSARPAPRLPSSSDSSSPTEDIVRDAKRRIKSLEEQSEAITRYHKDFQARLLNESVLSSIHGAASGQMFPPPRSFHAESTLYSPGGHVFPPPAHQSHAESTLYSPRTLAHPSPKLTKSRSPRRTLDLPKPTPEKIKLNHVSFSELPEVAAPVSSPRGVVSSPRPAAPAAARGAEDSILPAAGRYVEDSVLDTSLLKDDTSQNGILADVSKQESEVDKVDNTTAEPIIIPMLKLVPRDLEVDMIAEPIVPVLVPRAPNPRRESSSSSSSLHISAGISLKDDDFWGL